MRKISKCSGGMKGVIEGCNVCVDSCLARVIRHLEQDDDYWRDDSYQNIEAAILIISQARQLAKL